MVTMARASSGAVTANTASHAVIMLHGGDCSLVPFANTSEPDASACLGRHQAFDLSPMRGTRPLIKAGNTVSPWPHYTKETLPRM